MTETGSGREGGRSLRHSSDGHPARCGRADNGEDGLVLPVALVVLVSLTLLATAALTLARFEYAAARAGGHHARARLAAEVAAASGPGRWRPALADSIPTWGSGAREAVSMTGPAASGLRASLDWTRASRRTWVARGTGRSGTAQATATQLLWALDPLAEAAESPAVVLTGTKSPVLAMGIVNGNRVHSVPAPSPGLDCPAAAAVFDSLASGGYRASIQRADSALVASVGLLNLDTLLARLPDRVGLSGTPGPVVRLGACDPAGGWNWGEPNDSTHPCAGQRISGGSSNSLLATGGRGQGLLVGLSDITLRDVDFFGLVITAGALRLEGSASVHGAVRAAGGFTTGSGTTVTGSACWAAWALDLGEVTSPVSVVDAPEWLGRQ